MLCHGSSPRLRGTSTGVWVPLDGVRFIPAPAGNMASRAWPSLLPPVHPRACGEHANRTATSISSAGSSPRLRGTWSLGGSHELDNRFIPAPAGNIASQAAVCCSTAVHPRACGEHASLGQQNEPLFGSSPRLRGTFLAGWRGAGRPRFIPAPAGNITGSKLSAINTSVHPRACGEHRPT